MTSRPPRHLVALLLASLCVAPACNGCQDEQEPKVIADMDASADMSPADMPAPVDMPVDMPLPTDMQPPADMQPPRDMEPPPWDFGPPEDMTTAPFALEQVVPPSGPLEGDTLVRLRGTQLSDGMRVFFGGEEVQVRQVNDAFTLRTPAATVAGPVTVKVISPDGEVSALENGYTYLDAVRLDAVVPSVLPTRGGVWVELTGAGFTEEVAVSFNGAPAEQVMFLSPQKLRVLAPARPRGLADVRVTTQLGSVVRPEAVRYVEPLAITLLDPAAGPVAGGNRVTIRGTGITSKTRATFGDREAAVVQADAATGTLLVTVPPGVAPGAVNVTLTDDHTAALLRDAYRYTDALAPGLEVVRPASGSTAGGESVVVVGYGFDRPGAVVRFDGQDATIVESAPTWALVRPPAHAAGAVDVSLHDSTGELGRLTDAYTYQQAVWIDQLTPNTGTRDGGDAITITGEGFTGLERVIFGGVSAAFTVISDTELRVTTPPHTPGTVDVRAERAGVTATLKDAYTYTAPLRVWGFTPARGSISGGTFVSLRGEGFTGAVEVSVNGKPATQLRRVDVNNLTFLTPPNARGEYEVAVRTGGQRAVAPYPFQYFNPGNRFGGASGERIEGAVNVTVFTREGAPIPFAFVMLSTRADSRYQGVTDENGMVTLSGPDVIGAQTITATAPGFSATTVQTIDAENVTIFLNPTELPPPTPPSGGGGGGETPPIPSAKITGTIRSVGKIADPNSMTSYDMAIISTTSASGSGFTPDPGEGNVVIGEGRYEINTRIGDMAVIGLCGVYDETTETFDPQYIAIERFVFMSDQETRDIDLLCDTPLDRDLRVKLINPIYSPTGPDINRARVLWDFGFEGTFRPPTSARGVTNILTIPRQPRREGVLSDLKFNITGGSYTGEFTPYTQSYLSGVTDITSTVALPPLLDVPEQVAPTPGSPAVIQNRELRWEYAGPYFPDLFVVTLRNSFGLNVWQVFVEGDRTSVTLPEFPDFSALPPDLQPTPYPGEELYLTIQAVRMSDPAWTFERFTYEDLVSSRWEAVAINRWQVFL